MRAIFIVLSMSCLAFAQGPGSQKFQVTDTQRVEFLAKRTARRGLDSMSSRSKAGTGRMWRSRPPSPRAISTVPEIARRPSRNWGDCGSLRSGINNEKDGLFGTLTPVTAELNQGDEH